jgi:hypothetical protein
VACSGASMAGADSIIALTCWTCTKKSPLRGCESRCSAAALVFPLRRVAAQTGGEIGSSRRHLRGCGCGPQCQWAAPCAQAKSCQPCIANLPCARLRRSTR